MIIIIHILLLLLSIYLFIIAISVYIIICYYYLLLTRKQGTRTRKIPSLLCMRERSRKWKCKDESCRVSK